MTPRPPARVRAAAVLGVGLLAPVTAELLQAYLGDLGGVVGLAFFVAFLAPLYGGAALLVREVAVRRGLGWPGRVILGAAFGLAMTTLVDLSTFTRSNPDIAYWDDLMSTTAVGRFSVFALVAWVTGHVVMSIAMPLAVVETLAQEPRPWLGRPGLAVTAVLMVAVAVALHLDARDGGGVRVSTVDLLVSAVLVAGVGGLAFTRWGRPLGRRTGTAPAPVWCAVAAFVVVAAFDLVPISWLGVAVDVALLAIGGLLVARWSVTSAWGERHVAGLAFGALLSRTMVGFLAPLPAHTSWAEKIGQNTAYLALVVVLGVALERRTRRAVGGSATLAP